VTSHGLMSAKSRPRDDSEWMPTLDKQRYRILVTGLPGTGKTTLVAALATALKLPVVREAALELRGLGLKISEHGGGSDLAAIAIHQYP
jgi:SpoVK/Ycf46/Vps4 family AAA+-type ATPase